MSTYVTKRAKELGLKKVDAKENLTIKLRPQDVTKSKLKNSKECAFAKCAKETVPGVKKAYFFRSTAWLEYDDTIVKYKLPGSMQKEIVSFDRARAMAPGTYQLSKPVPSERKAAIRARSLARKGRHKEGNGTIKRKFIHQTTGIRTLKEPK